jgi:hypothetical protein
MNEYYKLALASALDLDNEQLRALISDLEMELDCRETPEDEESLRMIDDYEQNKDQLSLDECINNQTINEQ